MFPILQVLKKNIFVNIIFCNSFVAPTSIDFLSIIFNKTTFLRISNNRTRNKNQPNTSALTHNNHHNHHIASNPISVAQVFITFLCLGFHRETVLSQIRFLFSYKINLIHIVFAFASFLFLFECFLIFL